MFTAKPKPTPTPTPTSEPTPKKTTPTTDNTNTTHSISAWIIHHPISIPIILIVLLIGVNIAWYKLRQYQLTKGKPTRTLGPITKDTLKFAFKEDKRPLHKKTPWATGTRVYGVLTLITILTIWPGLPIPTPIPLIILIILYATRYNKIAKARYAITRQMFDVANGEIRYPKGAELNPWAYVNITSWTNLTQPGQTIVNITAAYQSEDQKTRERFERNFNGTVSEENAWTYKWESAKNRIICQPAAFLPDMAPYPGPGPKWDEIPIGIKGDGTHAIIPLSTTPHSLICGPTGSGKHTSMETYLSTPSGWTQLKYVKVGDYLFDKDGSPTKVLGLSPIVTPDQCYDVKFSDGSVVKASADHLWWTETRAVRESRWTEARKPRVRRPLIQPDRVALLRAEAAAAGVDDEISVLEVARLADVAESSSWLLKVARGVGVTSEQTVQRMHHYDGQVVQQEQTVFRFNEREVFEKLGSYQARIPEWFSRRDECAKFAMRAEEGDTVTVAGVSEIISADVKMVDKVLRAGNVSRSARPGFGKTLFWDARESWNVLANQTSTKEPSWYGRREEFSRYACGVDSEATITARTLGEVLGSERTAVLGFLKRLGVQGVESREMVDLVVSEKQVVKESGPVRFYNKKALLSALADHGERFAWDQRFKQAHGSVKTTQEILETLRTSHGHANHSVPVAGALQFPEADLPIQPYTLGAWLGDGHSNAGTFCGIDHQIADLVKEDGYHLWEQFAFKPNTHPDFREWTVDKMRPLLKQLGVLNAHSAKGLRTKRIPDVYLRSSIEQRQHLLQGLMDTDGTVGDKGSCEITQVNEVLAYDVRDLVNSLGFRASIREGRSMLDGVDHGPAWTVSWSCDPDVWSPFRLDRKVAAHRERSRFHGERNSVRYIVDVVPCESVPMRCVVVDSPDHLFLVGESLIPTHNSVLQRSVLFHVLSHSDTWRIVAIDMKKVEMAWLKKYPDRVLKVATDLEEAVEVLRSLRAEMMRRYEEMENAGVNHAKDLPDPPKAIFCMIDESTVLLAPEGIKSDEGKERDALHAEAGMIIGELGRLSRASMIHVMACFQRPDATFLKGETKANFDARVAAGRMDTTPSLMVLDSEAANRLPKIKGRGIVRIGGELDTFQGFFAEQDWFDQWLLKQQQGSEATETSVDVSPDKNGTAGKSRGGFLKGLKEKAQVRADDIKDISSDEISKNERISSPQPSNDFEEYEESFDDENIDLEKFLASHISDDETDYVEDEDDVSDEPDDNDTETVLETIPAENADMPPVYVTEPSEAAETVSNAPSEPPAPPTQNPPRTMRPGGSLPNYSRNRKSEQQETQQSVSGQSNRIQQPTPPKMPLRSSGNPGIPTRPQGLPVRPSSDNQ